MDPGTFFTISTTWLIVIFSLICVIYVTLLLAEYHNLQERSLQKRILFYFVCFTGVFLTRLLYQFYPKLFLLWSPFLYAFHTCLGVALYYIADLLASPEKKGSPLLHILLPLAMPVLLLVWIPFISLDAVLPRLFTMFLQTEVVFVGGYLIASLVRIHNFQRSLTKEQSSYSCYRKRGFISMTILTGIAWGHSFLTILVSSGAGCSPLWLLIPTAIAIAVMEVIWLCNQQRYNYLPQYRIPFKKTTNPEKEIFPVVPEQKKRIVAEAVVKHLSQRDFDYYFKQHKPYLNPKLQLTSLADALGVTREELSRFINKTYKMNFNTFLGRQRLEELERLRKQTKNNDVTIKKLLLQAGFPYYNSYMRARREAENQTPNKHQEKKEE